MDSSLDPSSNISQARWYEHIFGISHVFGSALALVIPIQQKCMEDLHSRVKRLCTKAVEEDEAAVQNLQDSLNNFVSKANSL